MSEDEYGKLATWFARGKAQYVIGSEWDDLKMLTPWPIAEREPFSNYRMRPEAPQMPDEVWVAANGVDFMSRPALKTLKRCKEMYPDGVPVLYIRAGAVIPRTALQVRSAARPEECWSDLVDNGYEYCIKP